IKHKDETKSYAAIIRHLLMVRLAQELHQKSHIIAIRAEQIAVVSAVIAAVAALFAGLLWWTDSHKPDSTIPSVFAPAATAKPETTLSTLPTTAPLTGPKSP